MGMWSYRVHTPPTKKGSTGIRLFCCCFRLYTMVTAPTPRWSMMPRQELRQHQSASLEAEHYQWRARTVPNYLTTQLGRQRSSGQASATACGLAGCGSSHRIKDWKRLVFGCIAVHQPRSWSPGLRIRTVLVSSWQLYTRSAHVRCLTTITHADAVHCGVPDCSRGHPYPVPYIL